jgi:hypothetical protein
MPLEGEHVSRVQPPEDGLEAYRRLIELQKQMIQMSQQHEQAKRACDALRAQVAREIAKRLRARRTWRGRIQAAARKLVRRLPGGVPAATPLGPLNQKQPSSC